MDDPYQEEAVAQITATLRQELEAMRADGEAHPVVLTIDPEHRRWPPGLAVGPGQLALLPEAEATRLLDLHVSAGVGTYLLGAHYTQDHVFRLVVVETTILTCRTLLLEEGTLAEVASLRLDLVTRNLTIRAGESVQRSRVEWGGPPFRLSTGEEN